jgi:hypothetical protein
VIVGQPAMQIVNPGDRLTGKSQNQIAFAQAGAGRRLFGSTDATSTADDTANWLARATARGIGTFCPATPM